MPGLAKTLLVRSLAETLTLSFKRIQFTPDLMPSDIIGSELLQERDRKLEFEYFAGPIFANLLLADEVNRTPPKTQSALLEAMQEHKVTVSGVSRPLPEAQLDRFMFSLHLDYPAHDEEVEIVRRTTLRMATELAAVVSIEDILAVQKLVLAAPVSDHVIDFAVRLAAANPQAPLVTRDFVEWGAGPRASQYLILGAKALALLGGKVAAETSDVRAVTTAVLQHRVITNYRATGAGKKSRDIVADLLAQVQEKNY